MSKPSVGATVHYVSFGTPGGEYQSQCRAAVVTEVVPLEGTEAAQAEIENWDDDQRCRIGVAVLNPTGLFFNTGLHQDEREHRGGTWHWPHFPEVDEGE